MKKGWKRAALAAAAAGLSLALAGCSLPMTGFADYDVSGYFQALLDSSYKGENTSYMAVAAATEEVAQQNNTTIVTNAAVNFCNTYGVRAARSMPPAISCHSCSPRACARPCARRITP